MRWTVGLSLVAVCAAGCSGGKGPVDGGTSGGSSGGSGTTALASQLLTETNGAAAAQAYKDHVPTATEAARTAAFLAYSANAVATGTFPQGLVASDLTAEMTQIALEYPDFFAAGADGGLTLVKHGTHGPRHFTCGQSCDPSASTFSTDFLQALPANLPAGLEADAGAIAAEVGAAAAALEQSGTAVGQAFDQAIDTDNPSAVQAFIDDFEMVELASGDIQAAAATLGITAAQTQALEDAAAVILAGGVLTAANAAIEAAAGSYAACTQFQATSCTGTTGGTGGGTSAGTSGASSSGMTSSFGGTSGTTGGTSSGSSSGGSGSSGSVGPWQLNSSFTLPASEFQLVADSHGNMMAAWGTIVSRGNVAVMAQYYSGATSTWSAPQTLATVSQPNNYSGYVVVALSDSGVALAAWAASETTDAGYPVPVLFGASYSSTTQAWSAPQQLGTALDTYPQVALNAAGDGWILFVGGGSSCALVQAVPFQAGAFGAVANVGQVPVCPQQSSSYYSPEDDGYADLAIVALSDGSFVAAWFDTLSDISASTMTTTMAGNRTVGGSWATPFEGANVAEGSVQLQSFGTTAIASWTVAGGSNGPGKALYDVYSTPLQPTDATWETAAPQAFGSATTASMNQLAVDPAGNGWEAIADQYPDGGTDVFATPVSAGVIDWSAETDLLSLCTWASPPIYYATGGTWWLGLAENADGTAAASWQIFTVADQTVELFDQIVAVYTPDGGWGGCTDIGHGSDGAHLVPLQNGAFAVGYTSSTAMPGGGTPSVSNGVVAVYQP